MDLEVFSLQLDYIDPDILELFARLSYAQHSLDLTEAGLPHDLPDFELIADAVFYQPEPEATEPEDLSVHSNGQRGSSSAEPDNTAKTPNLKRRRKKKPSAIGTEDHSADSRETPGRSSGQAVETTQKRKLKRRAPKKQSVDPSADSKEITGSSVGETDNTPKKRNPKEQSAKKKALLLKKKKALLLKKKKALEVGKGEPVHMLNELQVDGLKQPVEIMEVMDKVKSE